MWACYIGEISESYQKQWEPHTVSPDQKEPDVYDVIDDRCLLPVGYGIFHAHEQYTPAGCSNLRSIAKPQRRGINGIDRKGTVQPLFH